MKINPNRLWLAFIIAISPLCIAAQGQNLVNNPGFEAGFNSGWNHLAGGGGSANYSGFTVGAYDGTSLQAEVSALGTNAWDIQSLGPTIALTNGQNYILSFYARADADGREMNMVVQSPGYTQNTFTLSTTWQRYSWTFVAPGDSPVLNIQYRSIGTFQIDNVMIVTQTAPSSSNLVPNGGFERGIVDGWTNLAQDGGVAAYTETYADAYDGISLQVQVLTSGANPWSIQSLGPTPAISNGGDYRLSFYGKSAVTGVSMNMVLQTSGYMAQSFNLTDDWVLYTWDFTAAEDNPQLRMQFPNVGTFLLDDVSIVPRSTGSTPPPGSLVSNGNFESGAGSGWTRLAQGGSTATFSEIFDYDGISFRVQVTQPGANPWDVQALGPTLALEPGEDYILSFDARTSSFGGSMNMVIQNNQYLDRTFMLTEEWSQYTWTFTAAETAPSIRMQFPVTGTVDIDNIVLLPVNVTVGSTTLNVQPTVRHQRMLGFGAALSWYSSWPTYGSRLNEIMDVMFNDLGMDILRLKNWYYPVGYPNSKAPVGMAAQDDFNAAITYYNAAKAANPNIKILLSSWSPPQNLKSNSNLVRGHLRSEDGRFMYDEFADYWNDVLDNLGWLPDYLSFQNEPGYLADWESSEWRPTETETLPGYAEASEAIWNAIRNRPNVPIMIGAETENIGQTGWNSSLNLFREFTTPLRNQPWIGVYAHHIYNVYNASQIDGVIPNLNMIRDEFGDRPNFMTEFSSEQFDWHQSALVIHNTIVEANAAAYVYWKLVWASSPDTMISVDSSGNYEIRPHYYTIKHYSKHVSEGYQRIEVGGNDGFIKASAYLRPDGRSITMVVINKGVTERDVDLNIAGINGQNVQAFQSVANDYYRDLGSVNLTSAMRLPGTSITTLVIPVTSGAVLPGSGGNNPTTPAFREYQHIVTSNTITPRQWNLDPEGILGQNPEHSMAAGWLPRGLSLDGSTLTGRFSDLGNYTFTIVSRSGVDELRNHFQVRVIPPAVSPLIFGMWVNGTYHPAVIMEERGHGKAATTELFNLKTALGQPMELTFDWDYLKGDSSFKVIRGTLPQGLSLSQRKVNGNPSASISGTPSEAGEFIFVVSVLDWRGRGYQWIRLVVE
jgi:O-glycosyl hydrolase